MKGFRDWLFMEEDMQITKDAIKIALPKRRQQVNFSCGPGALKAIADYFQVGIGNDEDAYIKLCKANSKDGTSPENLVRAGQKLGLKVVLKEGMTIKELLRYIKRGIPVICNIQAWGDDKYYDTAESGHYVVAIGYDDKRIYFEDPSIDHPDRGYLSYEDFESRWHDQDKKRHVTRLGIAMWRNNPTPDAKRSKAKKIK